MRYPGVNDTLVLSMEDAAECLVTDAELPTLVEDGEDRWEGVAMTSEGETQAFAVDAGVLRDAVDDLEAVATVAKLALSNAPQRGPLATLSATHKKPHAMAAAAHLNSSTVPLAATAAQQAVNQAHTLIQSL